MEKFPNRLRLELGIPRFPYSIFTGRSEDIPKISYRIKMSSGYLLDLFWILHGV